MGLKHALNSLLPWQRKGYEVLDRYDPADPASGDRQVLAELVAHGADLSRGRHVVHYLYFPSDDQRNAAEEALREHGYGIRHGNNYKDTKSLIAERTGHVDEQTIEAERQLLETIAENNAGEYDGWEAALD
jgi:hypothetical protein